LKYLTKQGFTGLVHESHYAPLLNKYLLRTLIPILTHGRRLTSYLDRVVDQERTEKCGD